jgi:outer membrane protein assembly factor BamD (BamD/ComL family)
LEDAARICDGLLAAKPPSVKAEELYPFVLELARSLERVNPGRAAELLDRLAFAVPPGGSSFEVVLEEAALARRRGDFGMSRSLYEKAIQIAPDAGAKEEATFKSAVNYVAMSRDGKHDPVLLRRAEERFRILLGASGRGRFAIESQEYLEIIESLITEPDAGRRAVYYDVTRLFEPGYSGEPSASAFKSAAKQYRDSFTGETALFYEGDCLQRQGKLWKAFEVYEQFLKDYPASLRRRTAVEREFAIGRALADQHEQSDAVDVMEAVAQSNSNGPLADDALMFAGRAQLDEEKYDDARTTFDLLAQGYPKSKWNRTAIYLGGVADLRRSDLAPDNEMLLDRAHRAFEVYLKDEPDGQFAAEAVRLQKECEVKQARTLLDIARFYDRRGEPVSAVVYYRAVLVQHPGSPSAPAAKLALQQYGELGGTAR